MISIVGYIWKLLVTIAYEVGIRDTVRAIARCLFTMPAPPPLPKIPGMFNRSGALQAELEARVSAWAEVPFWEGAGQGFTLGFTAAVVLLVLIAYRCNLITLGKKL